MAWVMDIIIRRIKQTISQLVNQSIYYHIQTITIW